VALMVRPDERALRASVWGLSVAERGSGSASVRGRARNARGVPQATGWTRCAERLRNALPKSAVQSTLSLMLILAARQQP